MEDKNKVRNMISREFDHFEGGSDDDDSDYGEGEEEEEESESLGSSSEGDVADDDWGKPKIMAK